MNQRSANEAYNARKEHLVSDIHRHLPEISKHDIRTVIHHLLVRDGLRLYEIEIDGGAKAH